MSEDFTQLPGGLARPRDDGAAAHLVGLPVPELSLRSTCGTEVRIDTVPAGFERLVLYTYPMTGRPGVDLPAGWDDIPGARGCTPEACGFRDHAAELADEGAGVFGLSTQSTPYQQEAAERLGLPFALLSDSELKLTQSLGLPTFSIELPSGHEGGGRRTLLKRLTMVVHEGAIERIFYPVFPPDTHAAEVLNWLRAHHTE